MTGPMGSHQDQIAADRDENIYPRSFLHPFLHMKPKSHHLSLHVPHLPPPASLLLEQDITDEEHRRPLRSDQKVKPPTLSSLVCLTPENELAETTE
ncbi:Hypothetical protein SMAX5B_010590 [Scophthalmus maximus]|uniref:Uncharacterized protein n=1 Tax=Scophthalmus maximus TaxID=52904 RepID=A0A2U9B2P1_SCOMX|nr:Hypothetical protein SMAX5B_010590 [Scophthalmus maximus]